MIVCRKYSIEDRSGWNDLVDNSKNGTFMIKREYMEYHADRFEDASLVFCDETGDIVAVLPASRHGDELRSHGGLTYGGVVVGRTMTAVKMLAVFESLKNYMKDERIARLIYKRIPSIYYTYPSDEDLYALYRSKARLVRSDLSTTIDLSNPIPFSSVRKRYAKKAVKNGLRVTQTDDYETYIELLTRVLMSRHGVKPPHTAEEIRLLAGRFPEVIKLYCAYKDGQMLAGVLIFDTPKVVHAQYIANSEVGRTLGALDLVMDYLVHDYSRNHQYFDFGISTERGLVLNEGLVGQKEMFGGRGIIYEHYEITN